MASLGLFNSMVNWFILKRMDQIDFFLKHPLQVQKGILFTLLYTAEKTEYGLKHKFKEISSYEDFKKNVPIVRYEDFEPYIEKARQGEEDVIWPGLIKRFAKSSGTTNSKSKFIPITDDSLEGCHYKAGKDLIALYVNNHSESKLFENKNLRLGGSSEVYQDFKTQFGDLSALLIENLPFWVEFINTPSKKTSLMHEWESKLNAICSEVKNEDVGSLTGVPSWMMVLLNRVLQESNKKNIKEVWPNLEVFFHGGISFTPYQKQYEKLLGDKVRFYEIYNASEGFFGIQDQENSKDLLLMLDHGIFYEFIAMDDFNSINPCVINLEEVKLNVNYALIITTNGGLWRYIIGDTVKFTCLSPFRIKVTGRTKHYINAFGEELMIENVEAALNKACKETEAQIIDYTGAPIFMENNQKGAHEWVFEFSQCPKDMNEFNEIFDNELKNLNSDYEAKRYKNITLSFPKIHIAKKGLFYKWMEKRGKLGGQNKVPRLSNNREYIEPLLELNQNYN